MGAPEEFDEETGDPVASEDNTYIEQIAYEYDAAGNRTRVTKNGEETESGAGESEVISNKTYTYDKNGNQLTEVDNTKNTSTIFRYDVDNRLIYAQGKTGDTVDYTQENGYNGFRQRILKKETIDGIVGTTNYFYDGTQVLYTTDVTDAKTSFNIIGAEDNILTTARFDGVVPSFYTYTKDLRESTINIIGSDKGHSKCFKIKSCTMGRISR